MISQPQTLLHITLYSSICQQCFTFESVISFFIDIGSVPLSNLHDTAILHFLPVLTASH